jgi:hypothetical protein
MFRNLVKNTLIPHYIKNCCYDLNLHAIRNAAVDFYHQGNKGHQKFKYYQKHSMEVSQGVIVSYLGVAKNKILLGNNFRSLVKNTPIPHYTPKVKLGPSEYIFA